MEMRLTALVLAAAVTAACGVARDAATGQAPAASGAGSPTVAVPSASPSPLIATATPNEKPVVTVAPTAQGQPVTSTPPRQAVVGTRTYRIADAYLWRDFMPISEPGGKPLAASIKIQVDSGAFPSDVTVDHIWVIGPAVWEPATFEVHRAPDAATSASQIEVFASGGPKWEPGSEVNVDVRLVGGGGTQVVRITGVTIQKTI